PPAKSKKTQAYARHTNKPKAGNTKVHVSWTDLSVVWLKNLQDSDSQDRIQEGRDYTNLELLEPSLGLSSVQYQVDPPPVSPEEAVGAVIVGYGVSTLRDTGADITPPRLREGAIKVAAYLEGVSQANRKTGSLYRIVPWRDSRDEV